MIARLLGSAGFRWVASAAAAAAVMTALALAPGGGGPAAAQTATTTTTAPTLSVSIDASATDLVSFRDTVTLTAVVTNAPADGSPTHKWETRVNSADPWILVHPGAPVDNPELRWAEGSAVTLKRQYRVTVSYGTEASATSDTLTVTWTAPATVPTLLPPCTRTTTLSKPTGLAAQVNPNTLLDGTPTASPGILLTYDAPPAGEKVHGYNIYRRVKSDSTTLRMVGSTYGGVPSSGSQDTIDFADTPYGKALVVGTTYVYAIVAHTEDNCGDNMESEMSDELEVTYTAPPDDFTGGL